MCCRGSFDNNHTAVPKAIVQNVPHALSSMLAQRREIIDEDESIVALGAVIRPEHCLVACTRNMVPGNYERERLHSVRNREPFERSHRRWLESPRGNIF